MRPALHWFPASPASAVRCALCPHACLIPDGARGRCHSRINRGGRLFAASHSAPAATAVDPIEKKPLYHFLPGSPVLSVGTLGCNLSCDFCQNDSLSRPDPDEPDPSPSPLHAPDALARLAAERRIPSIAFTYNEPVTAFESVLDTAAAARPLGIRSVLVSNGFISPEPRRELFAAVDAANIDLKSFRDSFYRNRCRAALAPVLDTLLHIRSATNVWLEVTTLLIPGANDSSAEIRDLSRWIAANLGTSTPLHFSAFHPACEALSTPPTPPDTLLRARDIARAEGLRFVYLGNTSLPGAADTLCSVCSAPLLLRAPLRLLSSRLLRGARCPSCSAVLPGLF